MIWLCLQLLKVPIFQDWEIFVPTTMTMTDIHVQTNCFTTCTRVLGKNLIFTLYFCALSHGVNHERPINVIIHIVACRYYGHGAPYCLYVAMATMCM